MNEASPLPKKLRVILTGHAGVAKGAVAERFVQFVKTQLALDGVERSVAWAEAEEFLKPMGSFLPMERPSQQRVWYSSVRRKMEMLLSADYAFLSLHLSYRWYNRFQSPLSWRPAASETLIQLVGKTFEPDYCVCLIDDIQAAQHRIAVGPEAIHLRLAELLTWRNVEVMLTDLLTQQTVLRRKGIHDSPEFPFDRSPVVSGGHPPEMLFRYLFQPHRARVYASYPIGRTRDDPARRAEIDDFRSGLHAAFCVFDPVTIDELPLQALLEAPNSLLDLSASLRWPLDSENTLNGQTVSDIKGLKRDQIQEIAQLVDGRDRTELEFSVEERDLRLIDQADCVVVYRPQYSTGLSADDEEYQKPTGGTKAEIDYALKTARPVYIVHDPKVDGSLRRKVLAPHLPIGDDHYIEQEGLSEPENRRSALKVLVERLKQREADIVHKRIHS